MSRSRIEALRSTYDKAEVERTFEPSSYNVTGYQKPGRRPLGDQKRSERIVLTLTVTEMEALKVKSGRVPLATALRDHCEATGFFPESKSDETGVYHGDKNDRGL